MGATTLPGPPSALRRLETPAAAALADLTATFDDLQSVLRCCERLVAELSGGGAGRTPSWWKRWSRGCCRTDGASRTAARRPAHRGRRGDVDPGRGWAEWHRVLLQLRDHYADPAENPRERFAVGVVLTTTGGERGRDHLGRQPLVDDLTVRQTGAIAYALSGIVDERIAAQQEGCRRGGLSPARLAALEARGRRSRCRDARPSAGGRAVLPRQRGALGVALVRGPLPLLGPAFVAAIAYVDPGNFATNISAGADYGYLLLWVLVGRQPHGDAHPVPLGQGRHRHRPQPARSCAATISPRPVTRGLWAQAELVAIATDLAEVLGGAIALKLLFGLPLLAGGLITARRRVRAAGPAEPWLPAVRAWRSPACSP